MINELPLVSICIPTFNGEKFLRKTLDSVNNQTYSNIEVIISDDSSNDNTIKILNNFKNSVDFNIVILNHTPSTIGENWNNCVKNANGDYIKFLFQDDILEENCIQKMIEIALINEAKVVACKRNLIVEDENNDKEKIKRWVSLFGNLQKDLDLQFSDKVAVIDKNIFRNKKFLFQPFNKIGEPIVMLIHKNVFLEVGYFSSELKQILDFEYWYRILKKYPIFLIDLPLVNFRIHFDQATMLNERNQVNEFELYKVFLDKNFRNLLHSKSKKIINNNQKSVIIQKIENAIYKMKNYLK